MTYCLADYPVWRSTGAPGYTPSSPGMDAAEKSWSIRGLCANIGGSTMARTARPMTPMGIFCDRTWRRRRPSDFEYLEWSTRLRRSLGRMQMRNSIYCRWCKVKSDSIDRFTNARRAGTMRECIQRR